MADRGFPIIFDGHNDTVLSVTGTPRSFFERSEEGHIDLPRAKEGGLGGGFFAVFVRDPAAWFATGTDDSEDVRDAMMKLYMDESTLPGPMAFEEGAPEGLKLAGALARIARESNGRVRVVRTAGELQECLDNGTFAMLMHFEGAEPLDPEGYALDLFYAAGFRSLGLTWSRKNLYTQGVPFKFPHSPDLGPGLTDAGKELVRRCNELGVMIDLSHITERGFWDVAELSSKPLVATHSNAHAVCPSPRNLTDRQLEAIRETRGVAGLNFHVGFLRPDGANDADMPLSVMADHIDHMVDKAGIDCVALGSDFDGATMPAELKDAAGLPKLMQVLRDRGYDDDALTKIAHANWVRVLRETWGA